MTTATPHPGSIHTLTPHDLSVSGGGVARLNGLAVFLDKGLPGETLRCRITEIKPRMARADVLETLAPSPSAVPSFCPHSGECGGCSWPGLAYPAQLAWKERQVKETLRRIGNVPFDETGNSPEFLPIIPSPRVTGYRNKVEFAFGFASGQPAVGLRQRNAHTIVSVADCALCAFPAGKILAATRAWMRETGLVPFDGTAGQLRFLVVRCPDHSPDGTPRCLAELITVPGTGPLINAAAELGAKLMTGAGVTGFIHSTRAARSNIAYGERVAVSMGETTITERIGSLTLEAPPQAFLQANTGGAALLYEQARRYAENDTAKTPLRTVWDIYCGVGGMGLYLAREGLTLRGIETVAEAVRFARKNAAGLPGDNAFIRGDAGTAFKTLSPAPDLIITDPPRAGMAPSLTKAILTSGAPRIITVSCNPASLARDIALLSSGYRVTGVRAVDLFPHTPHVEAVAALERRRRPPVPPKGAIPVANH